MMNSIMINEDHDHEFDDDQSEEFENHDHEFDDDQFEEFEKL